jgi:hypothetical protein
MVPDLPSRLLLIPTPEFGSHAGPLNAAPGRMVLRAIIPCRSVASTLAISFATCPRREPVTVSLWEYDQMRIT